MAGEDYSIKTSVEADVSNFEKGMNKAEKSLKSFSSKLADNINRLGKKGLVGSMANVGLALNGVTSAFNIATKAVKKISQAIDECTEAYRKQYKAEKSLDVAIKNSSLVDGSATRGLKQFASEIQSISEIGDEELLPMMSQLIATGRTEAEVMNVIRVATDMSATGTISFDTAVQQLNATLNGNIGRLGQQNAELKNLTEEELKSGKAVEILGQKYNGLAQATADSSKQLKNALGDFKELVGQSFEQALKPMRKYFTELITKTNDAIKKAREHKKAVADVFTDDGGVKTTGSTESMQTSLIELQKEYERAYRDQQQYLKLYGQYIDQTTDATAQAYERDIKALQDKINLITEELLKRKQANEFATSEAEREKARVENEKKIADLKQKYLENIAEQEEKWKNIETVTKEQVSNEEKLKFYQENLVSIMTEAGGQISTNNQYYKDQMAIINDLINKIAENPAPSSEWASKLLDQRIEMLEEERDRAIEYAEEAGEESYTIWRDYNERILELKLEALEREKEKELNAEGITAEDKVAIEEYYSGEIKKIYQDLGNYKRKKKEEEKKEEINYLKVVFEETKKYLNKTAEAIKKFAEIAKKVVNAIFDTVSKLVKFSISDSLDKILEFEDAILTFFVETLPNLPKWMESVIQSVQQLFSALKSTIKADSISDIVFEMLSKLGDALPQLVEDLMGILEKVVSGALDGLFKWLDNGGLKILLDAILKIQDTVQKLVSELLEDLADLLENHQEDLTNFLSDSIKSASKSLPKFIESLLRIINSLIKSIADMFKDEDMINSLVDSMLASFDALIDNIPSFISGVIDLIINIITALVPKLPEIIIHVLTKIVEAIPKVIGTIVSKLSEVMTDIFSKVFSVEFWGGVFSKIGEALSKVFGGVSETIANAVTSNSGYGKNSTGSTAGDLAVDLLVPFGFLRHFFADGTNSAPAGLALVGEQGPELVKFRGGEQVINNRNTQKALAGASGTTINQNVTFNNLQDTSAYAMMNQLKQYNRQMAINGIL
jgi:predicted PurR-regulated permease PerM